MSIQYKTQLNIPKAPTTATEVARLGDVTPHFITKAEFAALENPPGSGKYPSLVNRRVVITDEDTKADVFQQVVPDYANMEVNMLTPVVSNIPTVPYQLSKTIDRDGFIFARATLSIKYEPQAVYNIDGYYTAAILINGMRIAANQTSVNGSVLMEWRCMADGVFPVKRGDVVTIEGDASADLITVSAADATFSSFFTMNQSIRYIPPKFVSTSAPVVSEDFHNVAMVPDYSNPQTLASSKNDFTAYNALNNGYKYTYNATRAGYLFYRIYAHSTDKNIYSNFIINGTETNYILHGGEFLDIQHYLSDWIPVSPGDIVVVAIRSDSTTANSLVVSGTCMVWFCPPKFVTTTAPNIVVSGASYSTAEKKTGETWIDGKPIYRRAFTGNIVEVGNTPSGLILGDSGIDDLVAFGGWWQAGYSTKLSVTYINFGMTIHSCFEVTSDQTLRFWTITSVERSGSTNNAYQIWAEYTKTTD